MKVWNNQNLVKQSLTKVLTNPNLHSRVFVINGIIYFNFNNLKVVQSTLNKNQTIKRNLNKIKKKKKKNMLGN